MNDSDGDTYFYDKENKIIDSVTPKENRAVLFDGSILHSSSKPIEFSRRIVLNINLVEEENFKKLLKKYEGTFEGPYDHLKEGVDYLDDIQRNKNKDKEE